MNNPDCSCINLNLKIENNLPNTSKSTTRGRINRRHVTNWPKRMGSNIHTMSLILKEECILNSFNSFQSAHILSTYILCEIAHTICSDVKLYTKNQIIFHTLLFLSKSRVNVKCPPQKCEMFLR